MTPVTICHDLDVAAALVHGGAQVVLCHPDATTVGEAVGDLRTAGAPGARVAVVVGDTADPDTAAAAAAMARELFGGDAVVVSTVSSALQLLAHLPG